MLFKSSIGLAVVPPKLKGLVPSSDPNMGPLVKLQFFHFLQQSGIILLFCVPFISRCKASEVNSVPNTVLCPPVITILSIINTIPATSVTYVISAVILFFFSLLHSFSNFLVPSVSNFCPLPGRTELVSDHLSPAGSRSGSAGFPVWYVKKS